MTRAVRGILFDLGDTVLNFGKVDIHALFEKGARLAYEYLRQLDQPVPSFARYHRRQFWSIRWNYLKSYFLRREFNSLDLIRGMCRRYGQQLDDDQLMELAWKWYQPLSEQATVEEGTRELLEGFRERGLTLGIVSNTFVPGEVLDRHLTQEGLLELFPVRVYSCDIGYRKPHARIFNVALRKTDLQADKTMFVGDSLRADIEGANRMGMISVLKAPEGSGGSSIKPRYRIAQLADLENVLDRYDVG
jgi:HAD superfamily hydrolase (TIGR01509 family)